MFPNMFGHQQQGEAEKQFGSLVHVINSGCSSYAEEFFCSTYFPQCTSKATYETPCKSICQSVRTSCGNLMQRYGIDWPPQLNCEDLTEQNCFDIVEKGKLCYFSKFIYLYVKNHAL